MLVQDIAPGSAGSSTAGHILIGNRLFFVAYEENAGEAFWSGRAAIVANQREHALQGHVTAGARP